MNLVILPTQIAELQPEWDEDDKSNGLLPPDAFPTQALSDRTQCYAHKREESHHQQFATIP